MNKYKMECEFCNKTFSSSPALIKHKTTAKYCLKIQGKESPEKDIITCEYCKKNFATNHSLRRHLTICSAIDTKKELKIFEETHEEKINKLEERYLEQISKLEESYKEQLQIKDIEIAELKASLKIYKESDECLKEIAKQPKSTTNKNTTSNLLYMPTFNIDKEDMKNKIKNNFTKSHLKDGQQGVAYFAVDNLLKDEDNNFTYICTDPSRHMFSFKNKDGIIEKDFKANKLTKLISEDVIKHATALTDDKIETNIKLSEIREMKKDNSKFTNKLSNLLYQPGSVKCISESESDFENEYIIESDIEDYKEELKKINEFDDGSVLYSAMREHVQAKIEEKSKIEL